jgi:hypothetical protein
MSMLDTRSDVAVPVQPHAFRHAMPRLSGRLAGVGAIKIAAIGSSTTAGEGDIVPYPQREHTGAGCHPADDALASLRSLPIARNNCSGETSVGRYGSEDVFVGGVLCTLSAWVIM